MNGVCSLGELAHGRHRDGVDHLVDESGGQPRQRRVRAHAAGVRALVAVEDALVVLGGCERQHVVAVAEQEQRHLLAVEELLDEHRAVLQPVGRVGDRGLAIVGDEHALAGGESVGLHDVGGSVLVDGRECVFEGAGTGGAAGGYARVIHDSLCERLAALELCGRLARTEHGDAALAQAVGDARDEWRLRADDDEVDVVVDRVVGDDGLVGRVEGDDRHDGGDAGVARSRGDLVHRCPRAATRR